MKLAVIGNKGSWYVNDIRRAAESCNHRCERIEFPTFFADIRETTTKVQAGQTNLAQFDVVLVRTMPPGSLEQVVYRMDALAALEAAGTLVLNSPKSLECAVDKFLTTHCLAHANLPVPHTIACESAEAALEAFDSLGGDVVVKPIFGSEGRGIVRVSDDELALRTFRTLERIQAVLYVQQYVEHEGFDVRLLVLDGKVLGAMKRRSTLDFRTNISQAGQAEAHEATPDEINDALRACAAVGAQFAGVDLLYDRSGERYVIEVNAVPGWRAFNRVNNCDVATTLLAWLESKI